MKCNNSKCEKGLIGRQKRYCSLKCSATNSVAIASKASHQTPRTKERNPNWKDGISKNNYHYKKIQKERYPNRVKAREILKQAIRSGIVTKPNYCSLCGDIYSEDKTQIHGHHEDYKQPLVVVWCCRKCHRKLHEAK